MGSRARLGTESLLGPRKGPTCTVACNTKGIWHDLCQEPHDWRDRPTHAEYRDSDESYAMLMMTMIRRQNTRHRKILRHKMILGDPNFVTNSRILINIEIY